MIKINNSIFNLIIAGVGGQGLITLLGVVAEAAFLSGLDVKTSELHGLSQRGGSVSVFVRFGKEVFSPVVTKGKADLIIALEQQESLLAADFSSANTIFVLSNYQTPTLTDNLSKKQIENVLQKIGRKYFFVSAQDICQKELGNNVVAGVFLLGYTAGKGWLPLSKDFLEKGIKNIMPERFYDLNLKAFYLGFKYAQKNI